MEDDIASWDIEQQVRQVVAKLDKIVKVIFGNSYMVETMQGERLPRALNGRYLKKYFSQNSPNNTDQVH